ncbi:DUF1236 domain-containing protein [Xanthobacteraceae bacterium Astr-EGSB]|uniref:DUF1236 domain-containing protein n=1 Tax=Astrobacterium formosum TaxID=3069710 RepID=UPI0027B487E6|nr:DUF1236 domain-containing protein [Xanthobacteraceae bacterium Astr-EGSB]
MVAAAVLGIGVPLLYYQNSRDRAQSPTDAAGPRTFQSEGRSAAGTTTEPAPGTTANFGAEGRARDILSTAGAEIRLTPDQAQALEDYIKRHPDVRVSQVGFTVGVGTAVPRQQALSDWPEELVAALPAYRGEQFFVADGRAVIVEKDTRRIIAIIPVAA